MKALVAAFVLSALTLGFLPSPIKAEEKKIDPEKFGALAYSPKTGKYGFSWNQKTQEEAEKAAIAEVKEDDAKSLTWVQFGWAVLAITTDNGYGYEAVHGEGASESEAVEKAITQLRKFSKEKIKTIVIVCSGDVKPKVLDLTLAK
jgi:hypothetical protein